jgi:hypothetical protein
LICLPPCSDSDFAEKSAVHQDNGEREKNGHFSSEINAVNTSTRKTPEIAPWGPFSPYPRADDGLDIPECLLVANRKVPLDRRPALGPEGDSLDDLR